jgi:hypothetical protein
MNLATGLNNLTAPDYGQHNRVVVNVAKGVQLVIVARIMSEDPRRRSYVSQTGRFRDALAAHAWRLNITEPRPSKSG